MSNLEQVLGGVPEKLHTMYPSRHAIGDRVALSFGEFGGVGTCIVDAVRFTEDKVRYDILVPLVYDRDGELHYTKISNVDSVCVEDWKEENHG